ncbi:MAG: hypothetical protein GJ680_07655 [Alteromonadaceae bacterium]|nr:hypothetical protein [Alteromonadaceae bacterium]
MNKLVQMFLLSVAALASQGCKYLVSDVYSVGSEAVSLRLISDTDTYIDQYQRIWALIPVSRDTEQYKAIPAGNNSCLLEEIDWPPYLESDIDLGGYIFVDGKCLKKETPYQTFMFRVSENDMLDVEWYQCPPGTALNSDGALCSSDNEVNATEEWYVIPSGGMNSDCSYS